MTLEAQRAALLAGMGASALGAGYLTKQSMEKTGPVSPFAVAVSAAFGAYVGGLGTVIVLQAFSGDGLFCRQIDKNVV